MAALDLGGVEGAGFAPDQQAAREVHLGQRVQTALVQCPCAIAQALAAQQVLLDDRVLLELLEFVERTDVRVAVAKVHDQAHGHLIVLGVVEETATGARRAGPNHRIAGCVHHQAFLVLLCRDFPDFLQADAVVLRIAVTVQLEAGNQFLAQMSTAAFGEDGVPGVELETRLKTVLVLPVGIHPHVTRGHALHAAILVVEDLRRRKAWEHFCAQLCSLFTQPAAQVTQGDDVVAVVVHRFRHEQARKLEGTFRATKEIDVVAGDGGIQGGTALLPVWKQLVQRTGFEHGAGENMRAHFRALLEDTDADLLPGFLRELQQTTGCGKTGWPRSHDDDIDFHGFALHDFHSPTGHQKQAGIMINRPAKRKATDTRLADTTLSKSHALPEE